MALHTTIQKCLITRSSIFLKQKSCSVLSRACYSSDEEFKRIENPELHGTPRGTGYRSSFNGIVCTVFGATGFIGRNFLSRLGQNGTQMVIPFRCDPYYVLPLRTSADLGQMLFTNFHLQDEESIRKAVKYSDVVVNLIGRDHDTHNFKLEEVHVEGARRIARICREMGVKKLIHSSSTVACPNPKIINVKGGSRFAKSKYAGELAVREEFPDAVIVRFADVWGELDRFYDYYGERRRLVGFTLFLHERGDNTVKQPVSLNDVVAGLCELVRRPKSESAGKTYLFVGPRRMYLGEMVDYISTMLWRTKEDWGYSREDSRLSLGWWLKLNFYDKTFFVAPASGISIERFERENLDDLQIEGAPNLEDLGIKPEEMDKEIIYMVRNNRAFEFYLDEVHERILPDLPLPANR